MAAPAKGMKRHAAGGWKESSFIATGPKIHLLTILTIRWISGSTETGIMPLVFQEIVRAKNGSPFTYMTITIKLVSGQKQHRLSRHSHHL